MPRHESDMFSDSDVSEVSAESPGYKKYKKLGKEAEIMRGSNPYTKADIKRGSRANIRRESKANIRRDSNADIRREHNNDKVRREYNKYKKLLSLETSTTRSTSTFKPKATPHSEVVRHFQRAFKATSCEGDSDAFKYLLRKAPVPVVLHHLHFLFYVNRDNSTNTRVLSSYNDKFNVVSRYFLKAMKTESRATSAMKSKDDVSKRISRKTPLVQIDNLLHFTPEFILLKTIQAGDMESHDQIVSEWELVDGFRPCRDLIAAFFGVRSFFSDTSRYTNRQALVISCICGGSVETLSKIVKDTDTKWLSDFTMRKTREMCTPPDVMLKFLQDSYGLKM